VGVLLPNKNRIFAAGINHLKLKVMAIPIERTPVLTGKAAEFYERLANMKESLYAPEQQEKESERIYSE
jgi:hypothetical protein